MVLATLAFASVAMPNGRGIFHINRLLLRFHNAGQRRVTRFIETFLSRSQRKAALFQSEAVRLRSAESL